MTVGTDIITSVSIAHDHADLDTIESVCTIRESVVIETLLTHTSVTEAFTLQTCNRFEAYVVTESSDTGHDALQSIVNSVSSDAVRGFGHEASLRRLMRVSCGLESLVLGEDQILGQVREAYLTARAEGGIGPVLEEALTKAIHVGERARTETAIDEGVVSLGSAAAQLAARKRSLDDASALVIGAGEMGTLAARSLAEMVEQLTIANRTIPHAEHVAETFEAEEETRTESIGLDALPDALAESDIVVSATGSDVPIIDRAMLAGAGKTLLIDIAQPRDIASGVDELSGVVVHDLASLESITDETTAQRQAAAEEVETMIDQEIDRLLSQYKRKRADEVIAAMYEGAEDMKQRELSTALSQLEASGDFTDEQREVVESLADALVGQLLSAPTKSLRDAAERDDWSTINTALQLFDPQFEQSSRVGEQSENGEGAAILSQRMREQLSDD
jgi:glutamyl-tRNA reductase